jgi:hypothetical protein
MKDFRQHFSQYTQQAQDEDVTFIILRKNKPVLEVKSLNGKSKESEKLVREYADTACPGTVRTRGSRIHIRKWLVCWGFMTGARSDIEIVHVKHRREMYNG